ncbi:hypothetical protein OIU76_013235 [Salix suchowensis]|nr:hypothetical protein OIU76_013235 [Salix suchowensis]
MILEKWRKDHFTQDGDVNDANNLGLQTFNPSREIALPGGRSSSKATQIWRKAATVIMVIISALFGEPSALISVLVQYWLSS